MPTALEYQEAIQNLMNRHSKNFFPQNVDHHSAWLNHRSADVLPKGSNFFERFNGQHARNTIPDHGGGFKNYDPQSFKRTEAFDSSAPSQPASGAGGNSQATGSGSSSSAPPPPPVTAPVPTPVPAPVSTPNPSPLSPTSSSTAVPVVTPVFHPSTSPSPSPSTNTSANTSPVSTPPGSPKSSPNVNAPPANVAGGGLIFDGFKYVSNNQAWIALGYSKNPPSWWTNATVGVPAQGHNKDGTKTFMFTKTQ